MNLKSRIKNRIQQCQRKRDYKKNRNVIFPSNFQVDFTNCSFEGNNRIGENADLYSCHMGYGSYIGPGCNLSRVRIGKFCAIGSQVETVNGRHPSDTFVSIHPAFFSTACQAGFTYVHENKFEEYLFLDDKKDVSIQIGNDVWIGHGVSILGGANS